MSDLIERLREFNGYNDNLMNEAADEITALRERVAEFTDALRGVEMDLGDMPYGNKGGALVRWSEHTKCRVRALLAKHKTSREG